MNFLRRLVQILLTHPESLNEGEMEALERMREQLGGLDDSAHPGSPQIKQWPGRPAARLDQFEEGFYYGSLDEEANGRCV